VRKLARTLAGFAPHSGGKLRVANREVHLMSPAEAVDIGIGYIPRERRSKAWCCFCQVAANITLADLENLTRHGLIDAREERRLATSWVERLKIRTPTSTRFASIFPAGTSRKWFWRNG